MDVAAYHEGFSDAYAYDAFNPSSEDTESYREGYCDGMDVNLQVEGGVCYQTEFEKELLNDIYSGQPE